MATTMKSAGTSEDVPNLFRLNLEVGDVDRAADFYATLLGVSGRKHAGSRVYFTVRDLDSVFERAKALDCLSQEDVHGAGGGAISVRPWGERSFYAEDPWQNPLCFVEEGTIYPG